MVKQDYKDRYSFSVTFNAAEGAYVLDVAKGRKTIETTKFSTLFETLEAIGNYLFYAGVSQPKTLIKLFDVI